MMLSLISESSRSSQLVIIKVVEIVAWFFRAGAGTLHRELR
jgi:hypothetical protein